MTVPQWTRKVKSKKKNTSMFLFKAEAKKKGTKTEMTQILAIDQLK